VRLWRKLERLNECINAGKKRGCIHKYFRR
jgi:hypothetical protein